MWEWFIFLNFLICDPKMSVNKENYFVGERNKRQISLRWLVKGTKGIKNNLYWNKTIVMQIFCTSYRIFIQSSSYFSNINLWYSLMWFLSLFYYHLMPPINTVGCFISEIFKMVSKHYMKLIIAEQHPVNYAANIV